MRQRKLWFLAGFLALSLGGFGGTESSFRFPVEYHKLANGLKVVLSPDHTAPIVAVAVHYHIGLRIEPRNRKELKDIQNYMSGTFVLTNSSWQGILDVLSTRDLHGLGPDYLTSYVRKLQALTPKDIQRVARECLEPEKMLIVVVGDKTQVGDSLKDFGPIVD